MQEQEDNNLKLDPYTIIDHLNDGVYAVDRNRKVVYWSKSAEKITGWLPENILGKRCCDDILCHIDKDDHHLCGEEYCPLHRAMVTNQNSVVPIIVFACGKDGRRIPMRVSVAPIRNDSGEVIGGVETFRDLSSQFGDLKRAREIQSLCLRKDIPEDDRIQFRTHYIPHDIIGGDYYAITQLDADCYGFLLADVSGHGVSAALFTMYLDSLWQDNHNLMSSGPSALTEEINNKFCNLKDDDTSFAAGVCGVFDLKSNTLRLAGAGNPSPLLFHPNGEYERLDCAGLPLGLMDGANYEETIVKIGRGDCLLFFTDGAIEISNSEGEYIGVEGLAQILRRVDYSNTLINFKKIEDELLRYSDRIRFEDDLTFLEIRL